MQVLASQLHFLANRNAELAIPPLFWPVNCIKVEGHVAPLSDRTVYSLYCDIGKLEIETLGSPILILNSNMLRSVRILSVLRNCILITLGWQLKLLKNIHPMKYSINTQRKRNELQNKQ